MPDVETVELVETSLEAGTQKGEVPVTVTVTVAGVSGATGNKKR